MKKTLFLLLLPVFSLNCGIEAEQDLEFTPSPSKADSITNLSECYDADGFDVCNFNALHVWNNMDVTLAKSFPGPFFDDNMRKGLFKGQEVTCHELHDAGVANGPDAIAPITVECKFPVSRDLDGVIQLLELHNHPNAIDVRTDERFETTEWLTGKKTGNTAIRLTRQVGVYTCDGTLELLGSSNSIVMENSRVVCSATLPTMSI